MQENLLRLYQSYYHDDQTPKGLVSSHWQDMFKSVGVTFDNKTFQMKGCGFGDLQQMSWPHLCFAWATISIYMMFLRNRWQILKLLPKALNVSRLMKLPFTYDSFRQVCSLALIKEKIAAQQLSQGRVIIIGDGYGFLAMLIKAIFPQAKICLVDLGKTLFFQAYSGAMAYPQAKHVVVTPGISQASSDYVDADFVYCPAEHTDMLKGLVFDGAINIASMQEMNSATINHYFSFLRQHLEVSNYFYCCNRVEKVMPGGEVSRMLDYPWIRSDQHLVDGICPWHQFYLSWHQTKRGLTIFNVRIPMVNFFDGEAYQRLTVMSV